MHFCISPVIANIYMEHIEHKAITTFHSPPSLWLRYVDDTFCILDKEHLTDFHQHLNSICSHIQFTKKMKHNSSLPFLDVLVTRDSCKENNIATHNSTLSTKVYKKPTHTDRYHHFTSHHPKHQKPTVAKTLLKIVDTHITNENYKHSELQNIRSTLQNNGFQPELPFRTSTKPRSRDTQYKHFTSIPRYVGKIRRILIEACRSQKDASRLRSTGSTEQSMSYCAVNA